MSGTGWEEAHSAGGVVFKRDGLQWSFLAIRPRGRDRWTLPKGGLDGDESVEDAALREVREETGVVAEIVAKVTPVSYFFHLHGRRFHKTVDYYAMTYLSGDTRDHDWEVDEARWLSLHSVDTLTFESERSVVREACRFVTDGDNSG